MATSLGRIGATEVILQVVAGIVVVAALVGLVALGVRLGTRGRRDRT